ncbi:hypothetical protein [Plantactinospora endophytica]|uniref:Secreted protein n=1 Tax=Plantactinospora endophytica TaxID=673535 RepID=A0ABQ4EFC3_9ACTN|nr:hypothetical protein [Plantactinospora endophytica]GIG93349.1 hypothetical protein Pen02_82850 [Plantactinospora endophytica]
MQTPIWVPLVAAALGIAGVLWTQWRADTRGDKVWKREREHEAQLWAREDRARTFEQRRKNYADFYIALKAMVEVASEHAHQRNPHGLPQTFHREASGQLQLMDLYGSGTVPLAARKAYDRAASLGRYSHRPGYDPELMEFEYDEAEVELLNAIRADLGVPGTFAAPDPEQPDRRVLRG